ncbi:MAG: hypothetical protein JSS11_09105 [Verrucomicrobia bacterium]|nr:hypothetical protein [Verrucomicrobiota bacterium]
MNTTRQAHHDIPALKERLLIPEVWQKLGLEGRPAESCRSPFREDKNPSFSISKDGKRWKDYGTSQNGDVIDFIAMARQLSKGEAFKVFLEMAGVRPQAPGHAPRAASARRASFKEQATALLPPQPEEHPDGMRVPLQSGRPEDRLLVAETRRLTPEAVSLALALRTLTFAIVQGYRCWLLTDAASRIAEARRIDGMPFQECGPLGRRKAHTLRGSRKSWPLAAGRGGAAAPAAVPHAAAGGGRARLPGGAALCP